MDYKTIRHHLDILIKNEIITMEGDKYGAVYFLSKAMEANLNEFNESPKYYLRFGIIKAFDLTSGIFRLKTI